MRRILLRGNSTAFVAKLCVSSLAALVLATSSPETSHACGGCFHPPATEATVVTGHRMAVSISTTQTVLWDQIQYAGDPTEFAWVLPVKPGAVLELSNDAWFEALDSTTTTQVIAPTCNVFGGDPSPGCSGGCVAAAAYDSGGGAIPNDAPTVTVVHEGTVGPYETVTLHSDTKGALTTWLASHNYAIDSSIQPVVDAYESEGFDFIALRLLPNQGVKSMKPVRVVSQGAAPTLPLRMVAAGTGANVAITLFVIGEGSWTPSNFPSAVVDQTAVLWDNKSSSSNYATLREQALQTNDGRTWLTTFARAGGLLSPLQTPALQGQTIQYQTNGGNLVAQTIAESYIDQGAVGAPPARTCDLTIAANADSTEKAVYCGGTGGEGGSGSTSSSSSSESASSSGDSSSSDAGSSSASTGSGGPPGPCAAPGELDGSVFACGSLDDLAVAVNGMHPADVWLTRLEANLPRAALDQDLSLQAATPQVSVDNWILATPDAASRCPSAGFGFPGTTMGNSAVRKDHCDLTLYAALGLALAATFGRRLARRAVKHPKPIRGRVRA